MNITTQTQSLDSSKILANNTSIEDGWSMFRANLNHTGITNTTLKFGTESIWNFSTLLPIFSSPAVVNGLCYMASENGSVFCFNASNGNIVWNTLLTTDLTSSPAVSNGLVYIGDNNGNLDCLYANNGSLDWNASIGSGNIYSSPAISNGSVYIGGDSGNLYCFYANNGSSEWSAGIGNLNQKSSPAIVNGIVYAGTDMGSLFCLNSSDIQNPLWITSIGGNIISSPAVVNGFIYIGNGLGNLDCLYTNNGSIDWNISIGTSISSSPAVANGLVYIGDNNANMDCFYSNNGSLDWSTPIENDSVSSPAVANGLVYVGGVGGNLECLNATSGKLLWSYATGSSVDSSPAIADGMVYFGNYNGNFYCLPMILCTQPSAPLNFSVTTENQQATLKWKSPTDNGGWSISGYTIYRGTSARNEVPIANVSASTNSFIDTGLTNGQTYYYEISAYNPATEGKMSTSNVSIPVITPTQPQNLHANGGNTNITLTWQAPSSDGGSPITGYKIYRGNSSGSEVLLTTVGANTLTYTDTGLSVNATYYYKVSAVNSVGEGSNSSEVSATTLTSNFPNHPSINGMGIGVLLSVSLIGVIITVVTVKKRLE